MSGNSMFNNFTNFSTTYSPNPFQPSYPTSCNTQATPVNPNKPYEILSRDRSTVEGYFWYYGNSVNLIFNLEGEVTLYDTDNYISVSDLINSLTLVATIYDFRSEPILTFSNDPLISRNELKINNSSNNIEEIIISMDITNELSAKLVKGTYNIELVASLPNGYNETLFSSQQNGLTFNVR